MSKWSSSQCGRVGSDGGDRLEQVAETTYEALIDAELTKGRGTSLRKRTGSQANQRNVARPQTLSTSAAIRRSDPQTSVGLVFFRRYRSGTVAWVSACCRRR